MTDLIIRFAPIWIPMLMQTWAVLSRLSRMEERLHDHEQRLKRIERVQDERLLRFEH